MAIFNEFQLNLWTLNNLKTQSIDGLIERKASFIFIKININISYRLSDCFTKWSRTSRRFPFTKKAFSQSR